MDTLHPTAADERQRLDSFRMRGPRPSPPAGTPGHAHKRSHSRNASISSSLSSLSLSSSTSSSTSSLSLSGKLMNTSNDAPSSSSMPPGSKRNSHHRRRSSVSTRHESAEMMGVAVPDLPPSSSSDNFNLGEKDSIRRRALLALEGKTDHSFSKVEIPELTTPVLEQKQLDLSRASFSLSTSGSFGSSLGSSLSSSGSKRDSFKMLASSSSSRGLLGALVEEEEEEEESPAKAAVQDVDNTSTTRHRPTGLSLRPLSLASKNVIHTHGLPTPSTPSTRSGLRSLALAPSPLSSSASLHSPAESDDLSMKSSSIRSSISCPSVLFKRSSQSSNSDSISSDEGKPFRRSSISYKTSSGAGLPTPEMTPTYERRFSIESFASEDHHPVRPLSVSEQHFLFKQHNALLARITDLEKALSHRPRSRPQSCVSDVSSTSFTSTEPNDEMLQLIADLKAERDDLKRDVDGWRTRVNDIEKQTSLLAQRLEAERREAWVARSRVGLLEVEKSALQKSFEGQLQESVRSQEQYQVLQTKQSELELNFKRVSESSEKRVKDAEAEVSRLNAIILEERRKTVELMEELAAVKANSLPQVDGPSVTDEEEGTVYSSDEEEDPLAGYEDEGDCDVSFNSESDEDFNSPRKAPVVPPLSRSRSGSPTEGPSSPFSVPLSIPVPEVTPSHVSRASLSKTWTFPKAVNRGPVAVRDEVDRFFGCFSSDDERESSPSAAAISSYETSKDTFAMGFKMRSTYFVDSDEDDEDDMPPFVLPNNVGREVVEETGVSASRSHDLAAVQEEDEDESNEDVFGEVGGIMITFTPPESEVQLALPTSPSKEDSFSFSMDDYVEEPVLTTPPSVAKAEPPVRCASPSGIPRFVKRSSTSPPTPSSIPRAVSYKTVLSCPDSPKSTPPRSSSAQFSPPPSAFVTPPTKRGGTTPSMIPHLTSSPPLSTPSKPPPSKPFSTFIRQPSRKAPLLPSNGRNMMSIATAATTTTNDKHEVVMPTRRYPPYPSASFVPRDDDDDDDEVHYPSSTVMKSVDWTNQLFPDLPPRDHTSSSYPSHSHKSKSPPSTSTVPASTTTSYSSFVSNPFSTSRLSSFANLIPHSWAGPSATTSISHPQLESVASEPHDVSNVSVGSISRNAKMKIKEDKAKRTGATNTTAYVSRDRQLRKLKTRLQNGDYYSKAMDNGCCKKCKGELVCI